jgi:hypothetical protein
MSTRIRWAVGGLAAGLVLCACNGNGVNDAGTRDRADADERVSGPAIAPPPPIPPTQPQTGSRSPSGMGTGTYEGLDGTPGGARGTNTTLPGSTPIPAGPGGP